MLGYMIKRAICNRWMIVACAVSIAIIYYEILFGWVPIQGMIKEPWYYNGLAEMIGLFSLCSYYIFAGMFPGVPYGSSLLEERSSGYLNYIKNRISMKKYMGYKIIAVGISGAVSTLIPYLSVAVPFSLFTRNSLAKFSEDFPDLIWNRVVTMWGEPTVYILRGVLMVLFGILWAELAFLLSMIIRNRYIIYILPFVIYQVLWIILPHAVSPIFMIGYDYGYNDPLMLPFLLFGIYISGIILGIWLLFMRQKRHEKI
ncbi:hypothetical protein [uncultured Eubacterium sp.]|uniref:hypothetical protein n=1 Tax=uncultured Eubacterium sp. TaxID=165185 RepID=UPI0025EF9D8F|nr:hypothetical protein [uncultured Eubacterium sp.]